MSVEVLQFSREKTPHPDISGIRHTLHRRHILILIQPCVVALYLPRP